MSASFLLPPVGPLTGSYGTWRAAGMLISYGSPKDVSGEPSGDAVGHDSEAKVFPLFLRLKLSSSSISLSLMQRDGVRG